MKGERERLSRAEKPSVLPLTCGGGGLRKKRNAPLSAGPRFHREKRLLDNLRREEYNRKCKSFAFILDLTQKGNRKAVKL